MSASEGSSVTLHGGRFENNYAIDGGVVSVHKKAELFVRDGVFFNNRARNGGGAFWGDDSGSIEVKLQSFIFPEPMDWITGGGSGAEDKFTSDA